MDSLPFITLEYWPKNILCRDSIMNVEWIFKGIREELTGRFGAVIFCKDIQDMNELGVIIQKHRIAEY